MNKKSYFGIAVIAAGMLGAMALSSCGHDDYYYSEEKSEQAVNEKYAIAFEKAFGPVGANVDWGFSSKNTNARAFTRSVGTYASYRGDIEPTMIFPADCDASNFLDAVPEGVNKLPTWGAGPGSYFIQVSQVPNLPVLIDRFQ